MKIRNRQQVAHALSYPFFTTVSLTLRTMTVPARIVADLDMPARIASVNMTAQSRCSALLQSSKHTANVAVGMVLLLELLPVTVNYLCQFKAGLQTLAYNLSNGLNRLLRLGFAT